MVGADNGDQIELSYGGLSAWFAPALGGRLIRLTQSCGTDIIVPLLETTFDPLYWPRAGAYPLIPYHNRIAHGRLIIKESRITIPAHPDASPHSLHGPAHRRKWLAKQTSDDSLVMKLDYEPDDDWPWAFEAWQTFRLENETMTVELGVRNAGGSEMPAGLGWHPYFAGIGHVEHDAVFHWPHGSDFLPEGRRVCTDDQDATAHLPTAYLEGWSRACMRLADGRSVLISADPIFKHLVVHRGPAYTCIEAVTHVADGFNLAAAQIPFTGAKTLCPGDILQGSITISITGSSKS